MSIGCNVTLAKGNHYLFATVTATFGVQILKNKILFLCHCYISVQIIVSILTSISIKFIETVDYQNNTWFQFHVFHLCSFICLLLLGLVLLHVFLCFTSYPSWCFFKQRKKSHSICKDTNKQQNKKCVCVLVCLCSVWIDWQHIQKSIIFLLIYLFFIYVLGF